MQLDALDLMQSLGGQIALSAMRADHHRDVFDDQEARALVVASGHETDLSPGPAADVSSHLSFFHLTRHTARYHESVNRPETSAIRTSVQIGTQFLSKLSPAPAGRSKSSSAISKTH